MQRFPKIIFSFLYIHMRVLGNPSAEATWLGWTGLPPEFFSSSCLLWLAAKTISPSLLPRLAIIFFTEEAPWTSPPSEDITTYDQVINILLTVTQCKEPLESLFKASGHKVVQWCGEVSIRLRFSRQLSYKSSRDATSHTQHLWFHFPSFHFIFVFLTM